MDGPSTGLFLGNTSESQYDTVETTVRSRWNKEEEQHLRGLIAFNQWFIVTYQAVLLAVVLLFCVQHLACILSRARRRASRKYHAVTSRRDGTASPGHNSPSSSSSSTLEGNATPPLWQKQETNEHTSLLQMDAAHGGHPRTANMASSVKAALMYQPRPIPFANKKMPSNATTFLILLLLGLNVFYTFYKIPMTAPMSFVLGDRSGLLFVANLPWLYLLSAKNQPIKHLTGYSYESLNILHRRLGEILCSLAVVHGASMIVAWWFFFRPIGMTLGHFLLLKIILLGLGAFAAYEMLYLTSLASFRQRWYELFLGLHIVLQTAALILLWFHHHGSRTYVAIALAILLIDHVVFRFLLEVRTVRADLTIMDKETVLVSASWPISPLPSNSRSSWTTFTKYLYTTHGWKPSEHIFLTIPCLGLKHSLQTHPFTIASAAPSQHQDRDNQHAWCSFIIRAHTGFTRDLLTYAQTHSSADVRLDGPYGSLHALEMLRSADLSVIVAGGSGIAVAYPLLWALLHDDQHGGDAEIAAAARRRRVCLVWVIHEAEHVEWIGRERLKDLEGKGLELVVPPATRDRGRPDVGGIVEGLVGRYAESSEEGAFGAGVVVSGPDGMNRAVRNTCAGLVRKGNDVEVAVEQYAW